MAEDPVVAQKRAEEQGRQPAAIALVGKEVRGERVLVEGAGDQRPRQLALAGPE